MDFKDYNILELTWFSNITIKSSPFQGENLGEVFIENPKPLYVEKKYRSLMCG
jgi:hypothetical protein